MAKKGIQTWYLVVVLFWVALIPSTVSAQSIYLPLIDGQGMPREEFSDQSNIDLASNEQPLEAAHNPSSVLEVSASSISKVIIFLVEGQGDCCMSSAHTLIEELRGLNGRIPGVQIVFAGLDARGLPSTDYRNYAVPWNSLTNRYEHTFDIGENFSRGTDNFIKGVETYIAAQPPTATFIFIGHSFGGDSILSLLQRSGSYRNRILFVGVIDPVDGFGIRKTLKDKRVPAEVTYFFNRWQKNQPWPVDFLLSGSVDCSAQNCNQEEQSVSRKEDGSAYRVRCGDLEIGCYGAETRWELQCDKWGIVCTDVPVWYPGEKNKPVVHQELPYDAYLQRQLVDITRSLLTQYGKSVYVDYGATLYVDRAYTGAGFGSSARPFSRVRQAHSVAEAGATLKIKAGAYPETVRLNKKVTLVASGGKVSIGQVGANAQMTPYDVRLPLYLPMIPKSTE